MSFKSNFLQTLFVLFYFYCLPNVSFCIEILQQNNSNRQDNFIYCTVNLCRGNDDKTKINKSKNNYNYNNTLFNFYLEKLFKISKSTNLDNVALLGGVNKSTKPPHIQPTTLLKKSKSQTKRNKSEKNKIKNCDRIQIAHNSSNARRRMEEKIADKKSIFEPFLFYTVIVTNCLAANQIIMFFRLFDIFFEISNVFIIFLQALALW